MRIRRRKAPGDSCACSRKRSFSAVRLKPANASGLKNLGTLLRDRGKLDESAAIYRESLRHEPDDAEAHCYLGMVRLHMGDYESGWPEYEWRRQLPKWRTRTMPEPPWDGSSLVGKTILLLPEQGLGDTLQFIRYAPLVKQHGGKVLVECPAELSRVLQTCPGIDQVVISGHPSDCR